MKSFSISGLAVSTFGDLFSRSDAQLGALGAQRLVVDASPGYPCRVSLVDAAIGETVILCNYRHHPVAGPYAGSGPIIVREAAGRPYESDNEIPEVLRGRLLSVRAYRDDGLMQAADVTEGVGLSSLIRSLAREHDVTYLHVHNARQGCYLCTIDLD